MRVVEATVRGQLGGTVERRWERTGLVVEAAVPLARVASGYAREGMWLDFANASLWLGVVLALAFDVRFPPDAAARLRAHRARQATRGALYVGLVALALWWAAAGELLNGFDAALWLLCFFAIEGNILRYENAEPAPCG